MSDIAEQISRPTAANQSTAGLINPQVPLKGIDIDELSNWVVAQIEDAKNQRSAMTTRLALHARIYEAKPEEERKSLPWDGACNLVVPVAATAVETVFTRITGALFSAHDLYAGRARSAKWVEAVEPMTNWLNWVNDNVFDAYRIYSRWILSCIKFGTSVLKLPWVRRVRQVNYAEASGGIHSEEVVMHDGPRPEFIPLEDFFWSPDANATQDIQNCEWIGQRFHQTWKQLKEGELSGDYIDVDLIKDSKRTLFKESETDMQELTGLQPDTPDDYELWEIWGSYPVDENGTLAEIVITIHQETRTMLRAVYNFYRHQERPFHVIRHFPRENSLLGIGLVEMLKDVQEEVTAIHRARLDNATLANTKVYTRTKGAQVAFDDIFPGAVLTVEDKDDLTAFDMGRDHDSLLVEEQHTLTIGEKRSGVSDYSVGRESSAIGSRATATSTMALIKEGNRRFQFFIREVRKTITDIGHQIISLYQQFAPNSEVIFELFSEKDARLVQQILKLPPEISRANILIDVKALDETNNKEMQQQAYMMMIKVLQETYLTIGNAFMLLGNPEVPEPVRGLAVQGSKAASKMIERLLESFDFKDPETFTPDIDQLLSMTAALEVGKGVADAFNTAEGGQEGAIRTPDQSVMAPTGKGTPQPKGAPTGQAGSAGPGTGGVSSG